MTKIKTLKTWNEDHTKRVPIAPRTHVKAVFDDNGNTLDSLMAVQDEKLSELGSEVVDIAKKSVALEFSGSHGKYIPIRINKGETLIFTNKSEGVANLYLRYNESSENQQHIYLSKGKTIEVISESDYRYIYIYSADNLSAITTFEVLSKDSLENKISKNTKEIEGLKEKNTELENKNVELEEKDTELKENIENNHLFTKDAISGINVSVFGVKQSFSGNHGKYIELSLKSGDVLKFTNTGNSIAKLYLRSEKNSTNQLQIILAVNASEEITLESDYRYIYIYSADNLALLTSFDVELLNSLNGRVEKLEKTEGLQEPKNGFLTYNQSEKKFSHYSKISSSDLYSAFSVQYKENNDIHLKSWRLVDGFVAKYSNGEFVRQYNTLTSAENEMAMMFKNGNYNGGYSGGSHGGESMDADNKCRVLFFADNKLISHDKMLSDFTIPCNSFRYIQVSALLNSDNNNQIRAYHTKDNLFSGCCSSLENTIKFVNDDIVYQYHAGMACVAKDVAKKVLLPDAVFKEMVGDETFVYSDNNAASRVIMWNDENGRVVEVEGNFIQGFEFGDIVPSSGMFAVWDRTSDSKYYRRTNDVYNFKSGDSIRNRQKIKIG